MSDFRFSIAHTTSQIRAARQMNREIANRKSKIANKILLDNGDTSGVYCLSTPCVRDTPIITIAKITSSAPYLNPMNKKTDISPQLRLAFPDTEAQQERCASVRCTHCSKRIEIPQWYADQGLDLHFCGRACAEKWREETWTREGTVCLDGRPEYRGGDWDTQARKVRERDGYTCRICGRTERDVGKQLDVHHILPFRLFRSNLEANRLENLLSVCPSCHRKLEAEANRDTPLFTRR